MSGKHANLPFIFPGRVLLTRAAALAIPKSVMRAVPSTPMRMFCGDVAMDQTHHLPSSFRNGRHRERMRGLEARERVDRPAFATLLRRKGCARRGPRANDTRKAFQRQPDVLSPTHRFRSTPSHGLFFVLKPRHPRHQHSERTLMPAAAAHSAAVTTPGRSKTRLEVQRVISRAVAILVLRQSATRRAHPASGTRFVERCFWSMKQSALTGRFCWTPFERTQRLSVRLLRKAVCSGVLRPYGRVMHPLRQNPCPNTR